MTLMTTAQAEDYLYRHDTRARSLTRMTKTKLLELRRERNDAAGIIRWGQGGAWSKDELVNELLAEEYPTDKLNQAIHAKYHVTGQGGSSACEYCHPHGGGRCDCSPKALEAELARRAAEKTAEVITDLSAKYGVDLGSQRHQTAGCACAECIKAAKQAERDAETWSWR